jgi:hypothetical protein
MKKPVKPYDLKRITSRMAQKFGRIYKGQEESYAMLLHSMESNMLKARTNLPDMTGNDAKEAVSISLFKIKGYLNNEVYDLDEYINDNTSALVHALMSSFDPFTNPSINGILSPIKDLEDLQFLRNYFSEPIMCLVRIDNSIDLWTKVNGKFGYFEFIENQLAGSFDKDQMSFSVPLSLEDAEKVGLDLKDIK